jgi:microcystin-dependent protein
MKKALVPDGTIVMWSGDVEDIPEPWALCDGQNGTPDLRDKFIVGAGSTYAIRQEGGKETVELTVEHLPGHAHPASTTKAGDHSHSFTGSDGGLRTSTHRSDGDITSTINSGANPEIRPGCRPAVQMNNTSAPRTVSAAMGKGLPRP